MSRAEGLQPVQAWAEALRQAWAEGLQLMSPREARQAWADALRSGKYEQGRLRLRQDNKYCCLGVACEVFMQQGGTLDVDIDDHGEYHYDARAADLPGIVRDWLSVSSRHEGALIALNDTDQASFEEIANYIERLP